ncbi:MAG: hypothetical protein Kow00121_26120 [Elainellaceae cyanobacterium]
MQTQVSRAIDHPIVFIDAAVTDWQDLLLGLKPGVEAIILDPNQDGIEQITATLQNRSGIRNVQIIAHGEAGRLYLGSTQLNLASLHRYGDSLQQWQAAFAENASILLYSCYVGADSANSASQESGYAFINQLSQLTGANIAASDGIVGANGSWNLNVSTGTITAEPALRPETMAAYSGNLAIITVTNTADRGAGSLRAAIASAQAGDTIRFGSGLANQTIKLTSGDIDITKNLIIDGSGAKGLTLSGNLTNRIFFVSEKNLNVTVKNLNFVNGRATTGANISEKEGGAIKVRDYSVLTVENSTFRNNSAGRGGAVRIGYGGGLTVRNSTFDGNNGTSANDSFSAGAIATFGAGGPTGAGKLVIEGSTFTNNKGVNGGAVYNLLGPVTIKNSVFRNNESRKEGGAVFTDGASGSEKDTVGGKITIEGSRFEGNKAVAGGGALYLWTYRADQVLIQDSTVIGNSVTRGGPNNLGRGGGIEFAGSSLTIKDSTIANNTSPVQGGGLWVNNNTASVNIVNATVSGNRALQDAGGGMFLNVWDGRPVTITNTTIANNFAGRDAGAIWTGGRNKNVKLTNTVLAKNSAETTKQGHTNFTLIDGGGNIVERIPGGRGPLVTANSRYVDNLNLGNLQQIGNDLVHPLISGSPAINTGTTTGAPKTDQRGVQRDAKPDGGAFELVPVSSSQLSVQVSTVSAASSPSSAGSTPPETPTETVPQPTAPTSNFEGTKGNDRLAGNAENNLLKGYAGNDSLQGSLGDDTLEGGQGQDRLLGNEGNDVLIGGAGRDTLNGGAGRDRYVYQRLADKRDTIQGFEVQQDVIDLSQITNSPKFASSQPFKDYVQLQRRGSSTVVKVDANGDSGDRFQELLVVSNVTPSALTAQNFVF